MSEDINVFANYGELKKHTRKTWDSTRMWNMLDASHYAYHTCKNKACRYDNRRVVNVVRNDYRDASAIRESNICRYIELYNERHADEFEDETELRNTSLWLDSNHKFMHGYHNVDTSTKYNVLHLKDEHPNWYAGIELEVTFDRDKVGECGYSGDRYDEYGDYDECGDYDDEGRYIPDYYDDDFDLGDVVTRVLKLGKGLFTGERDGSLEEGYSVELVSRPLSKRAWHSKTIQSILKDVTDYLKEAGAYTDQPTENGFHIHISRKFFEVNQAQTCAEMQKDLNWVFQRYQEEIEAIGGRRYNRWCSSVKMNVKEELLNNYGVTVDKCHIDKSTLRLPYADHQKAFIESNSGYTYEARVFHSTLDPVRILACIEFMSNISHGARDNALEGKTFGQITRYKDAPNLQNLIERIKQKQKLSMGKRNINRIELTLNH